MAIVVDNYPKYWSERGEEINLNYKKACKFLDFLYEEYEGYVAFDTETENLNKIHGNRLVSLQFAIDDKKGYVICIDKPYLEYSEKELKVIKKKLVRLFTSDRGNIIWIMHNAQFDIAQVVAQLTVDWVEAPVYDTQLFIHILDENLVGEKKDYSRLKDKAAEFFGFKLYEKEAIEARGEGNLLSLSKKKFVTYAGMDAYVTMRLFLYLKMYAESIDYWKKAKRLLKWVYSPAVKSFSRISQNGFYIDKKQLKWLLSEESPVLGRLEEIKNYYFNDPKVQAVNKELDLAKANGVKSIFGYKTKWIFDINKPEHKKALFFTSDKGYKLKKINGFSTDSSFQEAYRDTVEIVKIYEEEQELKKLYTSYMKPVSKIMASGAGDAVDGRVHPSFMLNGTVTGRLSCACIRKGTKIYTVRDISEQPDGINIEDVKRGDSVVCYDEKCRPVIKQVLNTMYNGKREIIRVYWKSDKNEGFLDCTPDHRIRLSTGDYIRADELKQGDSVLAQNYKSIYLTTIKHTIVKVEPLNIEDDVYDIEVEDVHNFIAGSICVHNCPNLQQIPRSDSPAKKAIKCMYAVEPGKGRCLLQADFCANEIRFWGLVSEDPNLCKAFNTSFKKGQEFRENPTDEKLAEEAHLLGDIHKQTASMMFDVKINEVDKGMRQNSKSLSLGIMYQRGVHSVAAQLGVDVEEAQKKVDKFNHKFPIGCQWAEKQKKFVKKYGYVESPIGRRRNLQKEIALGKSFIEKSRQYPFGSAKAKELFRSGNAKIASAERFSVNAPIQGIANDVAMVSSAMLNEYIVKHSLDWKIVNTVHDSVVVDLPIKDLSKAQKIIRKLFTIKNKEYMEKHFKWSMKTHVDIDFEVSQWRAKVCKKCGKQYMYGLDKCECGCKEYKVKKLNSGYGSCVGWDESPHQLEIIKKGLVEE